jgi:hypothetical protein
MKSPHTYNGRPAWIPDLSRAIDYAGSKLYGVDWIGSLAEAEAEILARYGPQPYGKPEQSIDRCPPHVARRLDRVIGRDIRMRAQRATVVEWLLRGRVMTSREGYDRAALDRALRKSALPLPKQGRPAIERDRIMQKILAAISARSIDHAELGNLSRKELAARFGTTAKVAAAARKMALPEVLRLALPN